MGVALYPKDIMWVCVMCMYFFNTHKFKHRDIFYSQQLNDEQTITSIENLYQMTVFISFENTAKGSYNLFS